MGSEITLTKKEIKDTAKIIRSLENKEILLKGTTTKINSQEGKFLNFLRPIMKDSLLLVKNVLTPLAKIVLVPLGLTAAASATDTVMQKKFFASRMTALIFSNEEMDNIMKIVKSLNIAGLLIKDVSKTIKNSAKKQLLENFLARKRVIRADEGTIRG